MAKASFYLALTLACACAAWFGYGEWLQSGLPRVEIVAVDPVHADHEAALPFFELMSPLPSLAGKEVLPKLEYKKGPPDRFLERISLLIQASPEAPKERIVYYGRQTRSDLYGLFAFPKEANREARYIEAAIRTSQGESVVAGLNGFIIKPLLLREASHWLSGVEKVYVMDQAGVPAFLFESAQGLKDRPKATALFIRRNSFYRVAYSADRRFTYLNPLSLFTKTFLTGRRADALGYVAQNLEAVRVGEESQKQAGISDLAWPLLLLAANVSVDPSSLEGYFHFAGLNAMLYRSKNTSQADLETVDALRNNVLASSLYAQDVAPNSPKSAEISRLARLLTRNFEQ